MGVFLTYVLALVTLMFVLWTGNLLIHHPEAGVSWSFHTGAVDHLDPQGSAMGLLRPGDRILFIDGVTVGAARAFPGKKAGDELQLLVERESVIRSIVITLAEPTIAVVMFRLEPHMIALAFWGVGLAVLAFHRTCNQGVLFFLFCQAAGVTLAAGAVSAIGPVWVDRLFNLLIWWLGPLGIHVHRSFLGWKPLRLLSRKLR